MFERKRYQFGYVRQKERKTGPHVWVCEDRDGNDSVHLFESDQEPDPAQMGRLPHRARYPVRPISRPTSTSGAPPESGGHF
jgi:hypothetical protein